MRKVIITLSLVLAAIACSVCGQKSDVPFEKEPKVLDIGSDKLVLYKDIRYGEVPDGIKAGDISSDRLLDLYIPTSDAPEGGYPVFLFIHGGGFSGGDKGSKNGFDLLCREMAERGYAVVSMNYYLTMKYNKVQGVSCSSEMKDGLPVSGRFHPLVQSAVSNASSDAVKVLGWIDANSAKYNLDKSRFAVCGGSAGAMTTLHLVYISGQDVLPVKAAVNLWGGLEDPGKINDPRIPLLTYHGDKDALINVAYAYAIQSRMEKLGSKNSVLHILEGKGHAQYTYIAENKADEIDSFLRRCFGY